MDLGAAKPIPLSVWLGVVLELLTNGPSCLLVPTKCPPGWRMRRWRLMLPSAASQRIADLLSRIQELKLPAAFKGNVPTTSLDSMSPQNPLLLKLADLPVARSVMAHSIIAVQGSGDYRASKDGVVAYASAHVDYVQSEFIVQGPHSCQDEPTVIEEIRRILHEHLEELSSQGLSPRAPASAAVPPSGGP